MSNKKAGTGSFKQISPEYLKQISILRSMASDGKRMGLEMEINDIARKSGLNDEKETQRYLYILEGHKLVTPKPEGDFTSKYWKITSDGVKVLKDVETYIN